MCLKVLVVEDHADTRQLIGNFVERWGFAVSTADSLEKGLQLLQKNRFDAIVSDIGLGDGSGYALVAAAKRQQRGVTTVAVSAYGSDEDLRLGKTAGFDFHLVKPFDPQELRTVLHRVVPNG